MTLYFAYRSGYIPDGRYIKTLEGDSILEWFQNNWAQLQKDEIPLFGEKIYGFPVRDWQKEQAIAPPVDLEDLGDKIERFVYCNEVRLEDDCIRVATDDDEIELAWFIFTERYRLFYPDRVAIWFEKNIPLDVAQEGERLNMLTNRVEATGSGTGSVYFLTAPIYDSGNFDDLEGGYEIAGIRLPELIDFLRNNELNLEIKPRRGYSYGIEELQFLKYLAEECPDDDLEAILTTASTMPVTNLEGVKAFPPLEVLKKRSFRNKPERSRVVVGDHSAEICIDSLGIFYNYWFFFDDLWVAQHPELAISLIRFVSGWDL